MKFLQVMKAYNKAILRENAKLKNIYVQLLREAGEETPSKEDETLLKSCGEKEEELSEFELPLQSGDEFYGKPVDEEETESTETKVNNKPFAGNDDLVDAKEFFKSVKENINEGEDDDRLLTASEFFNEEEGEEEGKEIVGEKDGMTMRDVYNSGAGEQTMNRNDGEPDFDVEIEKARAGIDDPDADTIDAVNAQLDNERREEIDAEVANLGEGEDEAEDKGEDKDCNADPDKDCGSNKDATKDKPAKKDDDDDPPSEGKRQVSESARRRYRAANKKLFS